MLNLGKVLRNVNRNAVKLTVLAVARPEKGQVCIAGITEDGEWIRPQGIYEADMDTSASATGVGISPFKNLAVSTSTRRRNRGKERSRKTSNIATSASTLKMPRVCNSV